MEVVEEHSYELMKTFLGGAAAAQLIDLAGDDAPQRFRSFYPVGNFLIGLRYVDDPLYQSARAQGFKFYHLTKGGPVEVARTPSAVTVTPPLVPHHAFGTFGFWHINDQAELNIPIQLSDGRRLHMLVEGFPERGRRDRFAWYCLRCSAPLYMREVDTGQVGLPGMYSVEDDAIQTFNTEITLRTCKACGAVHPLAYSIFPWRDAPEQREARYQW